MIIFVVFNLFQLNDVSRLDIKYILCIGVK